MAFQPATNVAQIAVQMTQDGQKVENIFYVQKAGAYAAGDLQEIADTVDTWASGAYMPVVSPAVFYNQTTVRDLTVDGGAEAVSTAHAGVQGSQTGTQLPNNVSFAIHRRSSTTGRHSKSRIYVVGLSHDYFATASILTSTAANLLVTTFDALRTELQSMSGLAVVYGYLERVNAGVKLASAIFIACTGHSYTDLFSDSMRRRLPGRGR